MTFDRFLVVKDHYMSVLGDQRSCVWGGGGHGEKAGRHAMGHHMRTSSEHTLVSAWPIPRHVLSLPPETDHVSNVIIGPVARVEYAKSIAWGKRDFASHLEREGGGGRGRGREAERGGGGKGLGQ